MRALLLAVVAATLGTACRVDVPHFEADDVTDTDAAATDATDATDALDAVDGSPIDSSDGRIELIGRQWSVGIGGEVLRCVRIMVPEDMYVTEFVGDDSPGTHHTVLTISEPGTLGDFNCTINDVGADYRILFSSENGGSQYTFPNGIGLKIAAGTYLTLAVHVVNTTAEPITARTSVRVRTTTPGQLTARAELFVAGDISFTIPSGVMDYQVSGGCTLPAATNLLAFAPHMHAHGTHQTVTVWQGASPSLLHDADYDVNEPRSSAIGVPFQLAAGDQIAVACTYDNGGPNITYGTNFADEQCFTAFLRYPATDGPVVGCAN
jgi:hypothetical protein